MYNENAPALLARALGLKKIDDLTKLIRELVLEPGQIKEQARYIVDEFAVLVATHDRLTDARAQVQTLQGLRPLEEAIARRTELVETLEAEQAGLGVFFARKQLNELKQEIDALEQSVAALMMSEQEVVQFEVRMVGEPDSVPKEPDYLSEAERQLFRKLRADIYQGRRLEQERLDYDYIERVVRAWAEGSSC